MYITNWWYNAYFCHCCVFHQTEDENKIIVSIIWNYVRRETDHLLLYEHTREITIPCILKMVLDAMPSIRATTTYLSLYRESTTTKNRVPFATIFSRSERLKSVTIVERFALWRGHNTLILHGLPHGTCSRQMLPLSRTTKNESKGIKIFFLNSSWWRKNIGTVGTIGGNSYLTIIPIRVRNFDQLASNSQSVLNYVPQYSIYKAFDVIYFL